MLVVNERERGGEGERERENGVWAMNRREGERKQHCQSVFVSFVLIHSIIPTGKGEKTVMLMKCVSYQGLNLEHLDGRRIRRRHERRTDGIFGSFSYEERLSE